MDSGCSQHMTGEKFMFLTLAMKEGGTMGFTGNQTAKSLVCELLVFFLSILIMCGSLMDSNITYLALVSFVIMVMM